MNNDSPIYVWHKNANYQHQLAGKLTYIPEKKNKSEQFIFQYNADFTGIVSLIAHEDEIIYEGRLPPFFEMNLPEGARMQAIFQKYGKLLPQNPAHLLTYCGLNGIGCLAYGYNPDTIEPIQIKDVPNYQQFLRQGKTLFHDMFNNLAINDGISGVQPKLLTLSDDYKHYGANKVSPLNPRALNSSSFDSSSFDSRTWIDKDIIVKGDNKDFPHLAVVEFLSMKAAQFSGIPIPFIELSNDQELLLVKRFDFDSNKKPLAVEESSSLCEKGNKNKYQGTYSEFAEILSEFSSKPIDDLEIYFKMIVLNTLIKNGDAHHKNFAVTYDPENVANSIRLSPGYDIVSTSLYIKDDVPALALSYENYSKKWFKEEELIAFGVQYAGLNKKRSIEVIKEIRQGIVEAVLLMNDVENKSNIQLISKLKKLWK